MLTLEKFIQQARSMIGARLRYDGKDCTVIEVLEDKLEIIVEADNPSLTIQTDAYGNARREMRTLYNVPILNETRDELHPLFQSLVTVGLKQTVDKTNV